MAAVKAFIINRDRLSSLQLMVQWLQFHAIDVHIIDNASTFRPLLTWYDHSGVQVTKFDQDHGPRVGWQLGLFRKWVDGEFIVSDSDLDLSNIPPDWLDVLRHGLKLSSYPKCGLSLEIKDIPDHFPFKQGVMDWEAKFWQRRFANSGYYEAAVDTTFALYRPDCRDQWPGLTALRTDRPYVARHFPWYVDPRRLNDEELYFIEHANPISTYAVHLRHHLGIGRPGEWPTVQNASNAANIESSPAKNAESEANKIVSHSSGVWRRRNSLRSGIRRVALLFDNQRRPDTTGFYCLRALREIADVRHFLPSQIHEIPTTGFDLYLSIDDGLDYLLNPCCRPWALWAIDTHLSPDRILRRSRSADFVFATQRNGVEWLLKEGINCLGWLPLAADPAIHKPHMVSKKYDACFVGHVNTAERLRLTELLRRNVANNYVGQQFFEAMARIYSETRVVTNRSVNNDVNMRVFEALGCGSFLLTDDLSGHGQEKLFQTDVHFATFASEEEFVDKIRFYRNHDDARERISKAGHALVLASHTYAHRMQTLLATVEQSLNQHDTVIRPICHTANGMVHRSPSQSEGMMRDPKPIPPTLASVKSSEESVFKHNGTLRTSIIILTLNGLDHTRNCMESVRAHTVSPYEVVVIDNGSTDGTLDYLRSQPDIHLITNGENRGFPAGANQGITASSGEFVLLLNNDVIVTPGWLEKLLFPLLNCSDIGLAGPCSNNVSGPQQIRAEYKNIEELNQYAQALAQKHIGEWDSVKRLVGFCLLFRRKLINEIGLLDERFGLGNFEDDDFCRRALAAGHKGVIVKDAFVHHVGSATFRSNNIDSAQLLHRNQQLFVEKWRNQANKPSPAIKAGMEAVDRADLITAKAIALSLCMIVRDSSKTLGACLESIRPWVDEIIVVDTGSIDNTKDIARSMGAKVFDFPWCDSFSAARNESLRHATGDWIFWLDADDTIDADNGRKLQKLITKAIPPTTMGFVMQVHCPADISQGAYKTATLVDHIKMFRRHPDIRFTGRIHEQILGAIRSLGGDVEWTDIHVTHSGSDHSPAGKTKKYARDLKLLELELADEPDATFALFNLGMTLVDMGEWERALNALCRSLQVSAKGDSHRRKLYALLVQTYAALGRPATAINTCEQGLLVCPDDPELLFRYGVLEQAVGKLDRAERAFLRVLSLPRAQHFASVDKSIFNEKAWHNLALVYEQQGKEKDAIHAWSQVIIQAPINRTAWWALIYLCKDTERSILLKELYSYLPSTPDLGDICAAIKIRLDIAGVGPKQVIQRLAETQRTKEWSDDLLQWACQLVFESDSLVIAKDWLTVLTKRMPRNPSAFQNLGITCLRKRDYSEAATAVRRSLELRPDYPASVTLLREIERQVEELHLSNAPIPIANFAQ